MAQAQYYCVEGKESTLTGQVLVGCDILRSELTSYHARLQVVARIVGSSLELYCSFIFDVRETRSITLVGAVVDQQFRGHLLHIAVADSEDRDFVRDDAAVRSLSLVSTFRIEQQPNSFWTTHSEEIALDALDTDLYRIDAGACSGVF